MQLEFEYEQYLGLGSEPNMVHFYDNEVQLFYLDELNTMYAKTTTTPQGAWEDRAFSESLKVLNLTDIENLSLKKLSRVGIYGAFKAGDEHKLIICELKVDISCLLEDGSISYSIDNPIAQVQLSITNMKVNTSVHNLFDEEGGILIPGARVAINFQSGDSNLYPMGIFYLDRSEFSVTDNKINAEGRNVTGKVLKDQTFDEDNVYACDLQNIIFENILLDAGLLETKINVESSERNVGMEFKDTMSFLNGIQELLKTTDNWKIAELNDGTIIVGSIDYSLMPSSGRYTFYRNKDIFSRGIVRDDQNVYRRVCIYTNDENIKIYRDVEVYTSWNISEKKTMYVKVPEGTQEADAYLYADNIAERLSNMGIIETFTGPIRPHIQPGDEAEIINQEGVNKVLGLITEVKHYFGKSGFRTEFTVDSGGRLGKGRLSDYIGAISKENEESSDVTRLYS